MEEDAQKTFKPHDHFCFETYGFVFREKEAATKLPTPWHSPAQLQLLVFRAQRKEAVSCKDTGHLTIAFRDPKAKADFLELSPGLLMKSRHSSLTVFCLQRKRGEHLV